LVPWNPKLTAVPLIVAEGAGISKMAARQR
jgi:hypothetical protein